MQAKSPPLNEKFENLVKAYELMPPAEIEAELAAYGIDPWPTIKAVNRLIAERLPTFRDGRRAKR